MTTKFYLMLVFLCCVSERLHSQNPDNKVGNLKSSWIGNSFPGGTKWVQHNILKAQVHANGEIHAYSNWDEAHQEGAKYQGKQNPDGSWYGDKIGFQSETDAYNNVKGDRVTIDGVVWYIEGYSDPENHHNQGRTDRKGTLVKKTGTSIVISDIEKATSVGIDRLNNLLMVTDDGPTRHTVRFYNPSNGQFVKQIGVPGGVWPEQVGGNPAMNGVIDSDLKFWDLVGCGTDAAGNIIVVMSDIWRHGGAVIRAFNPVGTTKLWELHSMSFCDAADADRNLDGTVVYGPLSKFQMNYSQPAGKQYTKAAHTINPYKYPNDWRITDGDKNTGSPMVRYVAGKKFLYYTGMYGGLSIYKFNAATDGEIAIPSEQRYAPGGKNHLDVHDNGDYYELLFNEQQIRKTPATGVNSSGNIIWGTPVIYNRPSAFAKITACSYVGGPDDEMLIGGFFPGDSDQNGWKQVGKRLAKYKNWNTSPTLVWSHNFTEWYHNDAQPVGTRRITRSIQATGDYVFVDWLSYNYNGSNRQNSPGVIDAFRLDNGQKVGEIFSGPETMNQSSWHDLLISFHVMKRSNGEYILLSEENWKSKHLMFQWCPSGSCDGPSDTQPPTAPTGLGSSNKTATSFTLSWTASTDNIGVTGYEVFAGGVSKGTTTSTSMNVTGLTCNTTYSMTVKARDAAGNWSVASTALSVTTSACSATTVYQAENFTSQSGCVVATNNAGYTGTGFLDYGGNGTWGEWNNVSVASAGTQTIDFYYANGSSSNRQCELRVNGTTIGNISFAPTGSWTNWVKASLSASLNSGNNVIRLTANTSNGGPNLDKFELSGGGPSDTQPPTAPTNLTTSNKTGTSFTLSWTASTDNVGVTGYEVFANGVSKGITASTSLSVTGLICNTAYSMTVRARDAAGNWSAASTASNVTTSACADTQPPTVPTNLTSSNVTETSFTLSWTASTDNVGVTGYEVFSNGVSVGTSTNTSKSISELTCGTQYAMTVEARDAAGNWSATSAALNVSTSSCTTIDPSMLVWWKYDETSGTTASDATGNGRSGSLLNGLQFTGVTGKFGTSLTTDGVDDICRYNQSPGVSAYPFSLSTWVKSTNSTDYDHVVYMGDGSSNSKYFSIGLRNGKAFICARNSTEYRTEDSEVITDGQWHLIVGVFESPTSRKLYVDGSLTVIGTNSVPMITPINRFSAGALDRSSLANQFGGSVDDVRLYGKALSAFEVSELFSGLTSASSGPSSARVSTSNNETDDNSDIATDQGLRVHLYPNPLSDGDLTVSVGYETKNASITINSIDGQLVYKIDFSGGSKEVPGGIFQKGTYILTVKTEQGVATKLFIKE